MKKLLKKYFKEIKRNLPCYNKSMRKMLDDLKVSVNTFVSENDINDFNVVVAHFGTAQDIAREFTVGLDNSYIKSYKFKKRVTAIVVSILAAIMIAVSALIAYIIATSEDNQPTYYDETITQDKEE